jgi:putative transposase
MSSTAALFRRHRYSGEIISYAVWLYYRFPLSYRDIELLLAERGVQVTYESIRHWCHKFGPILAAGLRQRMSPARPQWHLDEVFVRIGKKTYYLWRAADADGMVLDILVQERRNQEAAETFLRRVVESEPSEPRVVVTDKLASYSPAIKKVLLHCEHRQHKGLNNRAENSHQPTRQRERRMRRFKSPQQAHRFLAPFGPIYDHFAPKRHVLGAAAFRQAMAGRQAIWREITGAAA